MDQDLDGSGLPRLSCDETPAFEGEDHLVDAWRCDFEVALHVGLSRGSFVDACVGVNEGEILALLFAEGRRRKGVTAIGRSIH